MMADVARMRSTGWLTGAEGAVLPLTYFDSGFDAKDLRTYVREGGPTVDPFGGTLLRQVGETVTRTRGQTVADRRGDSATASRIEGHAARDLHRVRRGTAGPIFRSSLPTRPLATIGDV
jgi:hypothetical protein